MYIHMYIYICIYIDIFMYKYMYKYIYMLPIYTWIHRHWYTYTYMYIFMCIRPYNHIHTYIHIHIFILHAYARVWKLKPERTHWFQNEKGIFLFQVRALFFNCVCSVHLPECMHDEGFAANDRERLSCAPSSRRHSLEIRGANTMRIIDQRSVVKQMQSKITWEPGRAPSCRDDDGRLGRHSWIGWH